MTGAAIVIDDASAADSVLSVKKRVFAANRKLCVHRQRLMYRPGPRGVDALADDETLGDAGVARDGSAELDVLLEAPTESEVENLDREVLLRIQHYMHDWFWMRLFQYRYHLGRFGMRMWGSHAVDINHQIFVILFHSLCVFDVVCPVDGCRRVWPYALHSRAAGRRRQH
jgi:hypothetical protein